MKLAATRQYLQVLAAVLMSWSVLLLSPAAQGQEGEVFRIEANEQLPHCIEAYSSPLCRVEKLISHAFESGAEERVRVSFVNWLLDKLFGTPDHRPPYKFRYSIIEASVIEYRVNAMAVLDDAGVADYRSRSRKYSDEAEWLRPGMMHVSIGLRYRDRGGLTWPPEGWRHIEYFLARSEQGWGFENMSYRLAADRRISTKSDNSDCIGDPKTPLCAVETWFACIVRDDPTLCQRVTNTASSIDTGVSFFTSKREIYFTVLRISPIAGREDARNGAIDDYEVIVRNGITYSPDYASATEEYVRFAVKRTGAAWRILHNEITRWTHPTNSER